ncbi:MAG: RNA-binding S4 domain-containing protein [Acidimicrobiales bacterium]
MSGARVDSWLWAVRVAKTRSAAKALVVGGHVAVNGKKVKPAHRVAPGDRVEATVAGRLRELEVVEPVEKRVGAARAAECMVDHSPPPPPPEERPGPVAARERGAGRPTKRDRRQIERFRGS